MKAASMANPDVVHTDLVSGQTRTPPVYEMNEQLNLNRVVCTLGGACNHVRRLTTTSPAPPPPHKTSSAKPPSAGRATYALLSRLNLTRTRVGFYFDFSFSPPINLPSSSYYNAHLSAKSRPGWKLRGNKNHSRKLTRRRRRVESRAKSLREVARPSYVNDYGLRKNVTHWRDVREILRCSGRVVKSTLNFTPGTHPEALELGLTCLIPGLFKLSKIVLATPKGRSQ